MSRLKVYNMFISVYFIAKRKAVSLLQQHSLQPYVIIPVTKRYSKQMFSLLFIPNKNNFFRSIIYCILGDNHIIKANATSMQGVIPFMLIAMPPA